MRRAEPGALGPGGDRVIRRTGIPAAPSHAIDMPARREEPSDLYVSTVQLIYADITVFDHIANKSLTFHLY